MTLRVLSTIDELEQIRSAWDALAETCGANPFTRPSFCIPWVRHLGRGHPWALAVEENRELVALAPFMARPYGGMRAIRFIGHGYGTVTEVLVAPGRADAAHQIWERALVDRRSFLELLEYRGTDGLLELRRSGAPAQISVRDLCHTIDISGSLEGYLARRPKSLRRALRGADRRLAQQGGAWSVEIVSSVDRLATVLPEVKGLYDLAETAQTRMHFLQGPLRPFTESMLADMARAGALELFIARLDGQAVAFDVVLSAAGTLFCWVGRFDPAQRTLTPGVMAQKAILEHAITAGYRSVDLLLGDDPYKRRWSTGSYDTLGVVAARTSSALHAGRALIGLGSSLRSMGGRQRLRL